MRIIRVFLVLLTLISAARFAKADTIQFTVTITSQRGITSVPIGATFTGHATYSGHFDYNSPLAPPPLTSYAFTYPSAPASITGLKSGYNFIERPFGQTTPALSLAYVNFSSPDASFDIDNGTFYIFTPTYEVANGFGWSNEEAGIVTYAYLPDAVSPVPEPASIAFVGSGILAVIAKNRRRGASAEPGA